MNAKINYELPSLSYGYGELHPFISEEQLTIHHQKHHQAYVSGANNIFEKLDKARQEGAEIDIKALSKELSFNVSGHMLHSLFWESMAPNKKGGGDSPKGNLKKAIEREFGNFERFKKEFSQAAVSVEGSGWAGLSFCPITQRLFITQVEKHNNNVKTNLEMIMVLDVFEHAYYLDYKNERARFVEQFWNLVNWQGISDKLSRLEAR